MKKKKQIQKLKQQAKIQKYKSENLKLCHNVKVYKEAYKNSEKTNQKLRGVIDTLKADMRKQMRQQYDREMSRLEEMKATQAKRTQEKCTYDYAKAAGTDDTNDPTIFNMVSQFTDGDIVVDTETAEDGSTVRTYKQTVGDTTATMGKDYYETSHKF